MPKLKLQFGEVEAEESIPQMEAVAEAIEAEGIFGERGSFRGVSMESDGQEYVVDDDYIFVRFYSEISQEQSQFTDDGEVTSKPNYIARVMHFLLTRDGQYAFESTDGVHEEDALDYLIGEDTFEYQFTTDTYRRFTWEQMHRFYDQAFRVREVNLTEVGMEEAELDDDLSARVDEMAGDVVRADFSTGQEDNNLQSPPMVDALAESSKIKYVRMKDSENNIQEANQSGRYVFSYPADLDLEGKAERVRDILRTVTDELEFGGDPED